MSTALKRIFFLVAAMAGGVWAVLGSGGSPAGGAAVEIHPGDIDLSTQTVFPVRVAVARRGSLLREVSVAGTLRPARSFPVAFQIAGALTRHTLWNGRRVKEGEELGALDDRALRREHELAAGLLLAAQIEYRSLAGSSVLSPAESSETARDLHRAVERLRAIEQAWRSGLLSSSAFHRERREAASQLAYLTADRGDVIALKCGLVAAEEQEERTRTALASGVLRAPFDGVLANCTAETGSLVQSGARLGELIDVSQLLLDADVLESEIRHVARGDSAVIEVPAIGGGAFAGRVRNINPIHETATRSALVTIAMSPRDPSRPGPGDDARPGMYATARIIVERLPDRVLVPRDAVLSRSNKTMVFLFRDGRSHWTYVDVGEQTSSDIAIARGVVPGDSVIVDGHFALGHAVRVRIEPEGGLE